MRLREADAFRVLVVQDFEGVTVEDGDDGSEKSAAKEKLAASTLPRAMTRWVCKKRCAIGRPLFSSQAAKMKMVRHQ